MHKCALSNSPTGTKINRARIYLKENDQFLYLFYIDIFIALTLSTLFRSHRHRQLISHRNRFYPLRKIQIQNILHDI